jgi:hypothetical protein
MADRSFMLRGAVERKRLLSLDAFMFAFLEPPSSLYESGKCYDGTVFQNILWLVICEVAPVYLMAAMAAKSCGVPPRDFE